MPHGHGGAKAQAWVSEEAAVRARRKDELRDKGHIDPPVRLLDQLDPRHQAHIAHPGTVQIAQPGIDRSPLTQDYRPAEPAIDDLEQPEPDRQVSLREVRTPLVSGSAPRAEHGTECPS